MERVHGDGAANSITATIGRWCASPALLPPGSGHFRLTYDALPMPTWSTCGHLAATTMEATVDRAVAPGGGPALRLRGGAGPGHKVPAPADSVREAGPEDLRPPACWPRRGSAHHQRDAGLHRPVVRPIQAAHHGRPVGGSFHRRWTRRCPGNFPGGTGTGSRGSPPPTHQPAAPGVPAALGQVAPKSASSWASIRSVLASRPLARPNSRTCRGFTTTTGRSADNFDFLLLNLGYLPQGAEESEVLFTLIAERYERRSLGITSNPQ